MTDLESLVSAWKSSAADTISLLRELDDYAVPTDLPGWNVHDIVAHLAHLETVLAHGEKTGFSSPVVTSDYTQVGVDERKDVPTTDLINELEAAVDHRVENEVLGSPAEKMPTAPGNSGWTWETTLRNRVIDMWVHEQDIRRAVNKPGNLGSPGALITSATFASGMGFVLGKKVGAKPGTVVRWVVNGEIPLDFAFRVDDDGKARPTDAEATATLTMTTEEFTVLGAGRQSPDKLSVAISGDTELGKRVLTQMAVTP